MSTQEEIDLRRRYRCMGWWQSVGCALVLHLGTMMMLHGAKLLERHVRPSTARRLWGSLDQVANDITEAAEGLREASAIRRRSWR